MKVRPQNYLEVSQNGADPIIFDYDFIAPSNTGIPSGEDFNNDGDLNFDGVIDKHDLLFMRNFLRQPADACPECDIDGDGMISIRDARQLMLMCDYSGCRCQ